MKNLSETYINFVISSFGKIEMTKLVECKNMDINIENGLILTFNGNKLSHIEICSDINDVIKNFDIDINNADIGIRIIYDIKYDYNQKDILAFIKNYIMIALNIKEN